MNRKQWLVLVLAGLGLLLGACDESGGDSDVDTDSDTDTDTDTDPKSNFTPHATFDGSPADPLAGSDVVSCRVYLEERCEGGKQQRCEIYDPAAAGFVDDPDPLLKRVYLYDRWFDLYDSPNGSTAERLFNRAMPGDTPEAEWGDMAAFAGYAGNGDSSIWTGAALVSDIFRYVNTGTEADYQRMEDRTRALLRHYEVTGIPGYLARHHYLLLPPGSPNTDRYVVEYGTEDDRNAHANPVVNPGTIEGLPEDYTLGIPDGQGGRVLGKPYWSGRPSIDQSTGPMMGFPLAYDLLRDETLKQKLVQNLTCYLKRLKRMEIINLQENPKVLEEITEYFAGVGVNLDPDDIDLNQLDRVVAYINVGLNRANTDSFDRSCPDTIELEPSRVLDASDPNFMIDMLQLASDMDTDGSKPPNPGQIDHFYIVNVRGGDASHLMHLATIAYYFTGEQQYLDFLFDELIGELQAVEVVHTMIAFRLPDWCFAFFGDHITFGTHWHFITMLPEGKLRDEMIRAMHVELWEKALYNHHNAKFNVMYGSVVPAGHAGYEDPAEVAAIAVRQLQAFGGNDGVLDAPRRRYLRERQDVIDNLPAGITVRCPTEEQRTTCEEGGDLFGIPLEQETISYDCDGRAGECVMADGQCVEGLASEGLPPNLRHYGDFMWQRGPFQIGDDRDTEGRLQSPGRDLTEPYWMARHYGFIAEGAGQVLAWRETGTCP